MKVALTPGIWCRGMGKRHVGTVRPNVNKLVQHYKNVWEKCFPFPDPAFSTYPARVVWDNLSLKTSKRFLARIALWYWDGNFSSLSISRTFLQYSTPNSFIFCTYGSPTTYKTYWFTQTITTAESTLPATRFCFSSSLLCTRNFTISLNNKSLIHFIAGSSLKHKALSWLGGSPLRCQAQLSAGSISHELRLFLSFLRFSLLAPDLTLSCSRLTGLSCNRGTGATSGWCFRVRTARWGRRDGKCTVTKILPQPTEINKTCTEKAHKW